jgi:hypothetical protein
MSGAIAATAPDTEKQTLARALLSAATLIVILVLALPALAQDGTGPAPENAEVRTYGVGWDCAPGYRLDDAACAAIDFPENAYATGRSYGEGWECRRGYRDVGGVSCEAIPVPENAHLRSSGYDWECNRGYRQDRETCVPIVVPQNAHLTDDPSGSGWTCARGFTASSSGECLPIAVPGTPTSRMPPTAMNGPASAASSRSMGVVIRWRCRPTPSWTAESYGGAMGWQCDRGFEAMDDTCVAIDLPANAHLDRSGNRWRCDRSFHLSNGECILAR